MRAWVYLSAVYNSNHPNLSHVAATGYAWDGANSLIQVGATVTPAVTDDLAAIEATVTSDLIANYGVTDVVFL